MSIPYGSENTQWRGGLYKKADHIHLIVDGGGSGLVAEYTLTRKFTCRVPLKELHGGLVLHNRNETMFNRL